MISTIDQFDKKILQILQVNGRITVTELAKQVGLSKTPCLVRMKRLEDEGYIKGYQAVLDPQKLDLSHVAFVEVKLLDTKASALNAFNKAVLDHPEIEQVHLIAGGFDYLLKVRSQDISNYRSILGGKISTLPNLSNTSTYVSMETVKDLNFISL